MYWVLWLFCKGVSGHSGCIRKRYISQKVNIESSWSMPTGSVLKKILQWMWSFQSEGGKAYISVQESVVMNRGTVLYFGWNSCSFLVKFLTSLSMSSDFLMSFPICQQMLPFKLEQRFLSGKGALSGGFYTIPSFSVHMSLLDPTSFIVMEPVSSLSFSV